MSHNVQRKSLPKRRLSLASHAMPFKTSMPWNAVKNPNTWIRKWKYFYKPTIYIRKMKEEEKMTWNPVPFKYFFLFHVARKQMRVITSQTAFTNYLWQMLTWYPASIKPFLQNRKENEWLWKELLKQISDTNKLCTRKVKEKQNLKFGRRIHPNTEPSLCEILAMHSVCQTE